MLLTERNFASEKMEQTQEQFFALLRAAMTGEPFILTPTDTEWTALFRMAQRQSLMGVLFVVVAKLPSSQQPPKHITMEWMNEAEVIRGLNQLHNEEATRLTQLFEKNGRRTAILKGQANARLYPDKLSRHPGDIDIWVGGGKESVTDLLVSMGLLDELPTIKNVGKNGKATRSYHHIHLPPTPDGVIVEVHFRPSSGNHNPLTNRRLQRWVEQEILTTTMTTEGFYVPSIRFALIMQLSHIQRHFLSVGIGLRQLCDYYLLLKNSTEADRSEVAGLLSHFGLRHTAEALMWVLGNVLHLEPDLMPCTPDSQRGEWMLREVMEGGNFGHFSERQRHSTWRRLLDGRLRNMKLMGFDFQEVLCSEINSYKTYIITLPERIRRQSISLAEADKRDRKQ